jgi:hypothetical protein
MDAPLPRRHARRALAVRTIVSILLCASRTASGAEVPSPLSAQLAEPPAGVEWDAIPATAIPPSVVTSDESGSVTLASHMATVDGGGVWDWRDTLSFFGGYEGSKQPQDFGINAHFGGRASVNFGMPLWEEMGLGAQIGTSINATANAVQVAERLGESSSRTQSFTTVGVFQRTSDIVWALGYDFLYQNYYDQFNLGQWRGRLGYYLSESNEVGVQAAVREIADAGQFNATTVLLRPITQGSVYWRHTWANQAQLGCFVGMAEGHSEANVLGDFPRQDNPLVFGSDLFVPLGNYLALFGESNFMTPVDTGVVDSYLGVEIFPWGGSKQARRNGFRPVLPVANNTSMTIDLLR